MRTGHEEERRTGQAGFTLVEALVAMVVLSFGLIAVTNLFIVGAGSNTTANHSTAAAAQASEVMERLKTIDFNALVDGGNLDADAGSGGNDCDPAANAQACMAPDNYNLRRAIDGVGYIKVRWTVDNAGGQPDTRFIVVRAFSQAPLVGDPNAGATGRGVRSAAEFTTFRTCTLGTGCPPVPTP